MLISIRKVVYLIAATLVVAIACTHETAPPEVERASEVDGDRARVWMDEVLVRIEADALSPPVASRLIAYTSVAIYEGAVDAMADHRSLGGQLNELDEISPPHSQVNYDVEVVFHATLGHLLPSLFEGSQSQQHLIDFAESQLQRRVDAGVNPQRFEDSLRRGIEIADALKQWAIDDGYYERDQREFSPPEADYAWVPTGDFDGPLEPHWHTLRPFALSDPEVCSPSEPVDYSVNPTSAFFAQAYQVWETTQDLDADQQEIAAYWSDDPGDTATPAGHWISIAGQMVSERELSLEQSAPLYALLGIAIGDAVWTCWHEKYRHYLLRPVTYINAHIDPDWEPLLVTPPFPEYTSGHSTFSGASAQILSHVLDDIPFQDRTHLERGFSARYFDSFGEAAGEAARSRLYGGIHYPMGNQAGLSQGECVADTVLEALELRVTPH